MSWLNKITTRDGKLAPTNTTNGNGKSSRSGSRSVTPSPSLPKISLPPSDAPTPKVVLTRDDDSISPHTISPSSVHRADSISPSTDSLGRVSDSGGHRKYATMAEETPSRPREGSNAGTVTPSKPGSRSRSNSQSEFGQAPNFPLTESPTQSISSRRSGSIGSGDSQHFQSMQQVADSITLPAAPDQRPRVQSTGVVPERDKDELGSPGKKRRSSRQHAASVGAASPIPRFGKPPTRHQTTMGMGLASALVASGMGIAPPPSMLSSPTGSLAPPALSKKPSNVSANNVANGRISPERTRVIRPRPTRSSSGNQDESGSESDDYDSGDALSFNDDEIPITGFAVATMKRNQDFHELFPQVPQDDYLIDDYGCALQRDILIQGRIYISENHICFHANIFGWVTDLIIPVSGIVAVEKKTTAFVIPNAIGIAERNGTKYTFASFLARDTAYDVIHSIWRNAGNTRSGVESPGSETTPAGGSNGFPNALAEVGGARARKATQCACSKAGSHYPNTAMEMIVPGTPEQIYNLMFASGFIKDFLAKDQKLIDIQTSDWQPSPENQHLLSRNMSYIKPLSGGFGPKQTKCELREENQHVDYNDYASTITTTRTPDVPSGSVFSVKTRTCIMWAGSSSTKVVVTFTVEWTGKSFIKGIIERSCGDGQKTYYSELEAAMRKYIADHRTEFLPEGVDADEADAEAAAEEAAISPVMPKEGGLQPTGPKPVATSRGLQWALDTSEAAWKVASDSISGLFDILSDLSGNVNLSGTSVLVIVIVLLVLSNVYTIMTMGERRETGRKVAKERRETERERWVGDAVKAFMQVQQSLSGASLPSASSLPATTQAQLAPASADTKAELEELRRIATQLEERLASIKSRLDQLD